MQVCIVYDCLYPYTVGGGERWYRSLAEELAGQGCSVTLLTLRQWPRGTTPEVEGVRVVCAGPRLALYTRSGRRRIVPPLVFGIGVFLHLLRHGRRYDVVHTASFPFFPVLASAALRRRNRTRIVVDWHEVWTRAYWRTYLGPVAGKLGWRVQQVCLRVPQRALCFSRLHEQRLRDEGLRGEVTLLPGQLADAGEPSPPRTARPVVVFAGRLIREKRVDALLHAFVIARAQIPSLRAEIYGDGPERERIDRLIAELGLASDVTRAGFVDESVLAGARASALCLVLPSLREGYGRVVLEAAAAGVPVVLVEGPDNAATELVENGVNGVVAASAAPAQLAESIVEVHRRGAPLRASTAEWFGRHAREHSLERSVRIVLDVYAGR